MERDSHAERSCQLEGFIGSFSGCDGGNPQNPHNVWVCGIEPGGKPERIESLMPELTPACWDEQFRRAHSDWPRWQYHRKVSKLLVALQSLKQERGKTPVLDGWKEYMETRLYAKDGDCFKLNLFPFSSPTVSSKDWSAYAPITGGMSKKEYYEMCRGQRFKFFRTQREKYSPAVIIGTSTVFERDFVDAFGFGGIEVKTQTLKDEQGRQRRCCSRTDGTSTLIVTPFFGGRYGINSNGLLIELAKWIHGLISA